MNFFATLIPLLCILAACFATLLETEQQQRQAPAGYRYEDYLEEAPVKRAQTFVRFGKRAQTFVRFGRSAPAARYDEYQ
ncbi:hypothetical protein PMAYCL1PPCAC_05343 [Pristionchus mayeri]|uniref:Uncharacterized protein n=1 Tax=Pristionchus mayeri TaxID=1317129 RepID=A0AAN5C2Z5_9BILA|nr:hypothetical protein PMAYCL1PPCAC_05343 [Pristionchus mayeri]